VIRSPELEKKMVGKTLKQIADLIPEIKSEYSKLISPIDDCRSTKKYRHEICLRILDDFLSQISQNEENSKLNGINSKREDHI
jgi:CO/xanthine dehydrogenase FAD-binding subunit